ncbi:MAG: tetratricopeptide repeat protein, partial [Myxococcota bacterium]|nr:tetratricopeptide repeat protein [Myxococcota bacterium]
MLIPIAPYGIVVHMKGSPRLLPMALLCAVVMASQPAMADPVAAARRAHAQAKALVESGDADGAIKVYEKALIFAPAYPLALNELGVLLIQKGDFEKARDHLRQAVQWMPDFLPAWSNLGEAQRRLEDEDGVIEAYGQVLRLAPADASAWYGLALGLMDDREYEEARGAIERYLELAPETHPLRADAKTALDSLIGLGVDAAQPELPAEAPFGPKPPPDPTDLPLPPFVNHPGDDAYAANRFM